MKKTIGIFGATSHVAKNIILILCQKNNDYKLILFARDIVKLKLFLNINSIKYGFIIKAFDNFQRHEFNVIINCIGVTNQAILKNRAFDNFQINEFFDQLILDYLEIHKKTKYIYFSSGAIFGRSFDSPVGQNTFTKFPINNLSDEYYYGISKLNSEAKHRALAHLNIIDFRLFSFFSRFINLNSNYLLSQIITSIQENKTFVTNAENIVRDYIHPKDLLLFIEFIMKSDQQINSAYDLRSTSPICKMDILKFFQLNYGLNFNFSEISPELLSVTGNKLNYYSTNSTAFSLGIKPNYTSLNSICDEVKYILPLRNEI